MGTPPDKTVVLTLAQFIGGMATFAPSKVPSVANKGPLISISENDWEKLGFATTVTVSLFPGGEFEDPASDGVTDGSGLSVLDGQSAMTALLGGGHSETGAYL